MTGGAEAPNAAGYTGGLVPVSILRLRSVSLAGGLIARQHTAAAKRQPSLVDAVEERLLRRLVWALEVAVPEPPLPRELPAAQLLGT